MRGENLMQYDCIVVGAGFSGAVMARELADAGRSVLVMEKRPQIGGNMYDGPDKNGVLTHWYGPHIFHTSNKEVWDYVQRFSEWIPYEHRVLGRIDGQLVPIPFNFRSLDLLFAPA
ncbi:MAG: FAD-dependent oxidoreductase, partial [Oscillospiraceae bacterium]